MILKILIEYKLREKKAANIYIYIYVYNTKKEMEKIGTNTKEIGRGWEVEGDF